MVEISWSHGFQLDIRITQMKMMRLMIKLVFMLGDFRFEWSVAGDAPSVNRAFLKLELAYRILRWLLA